MTHRIGRAIARASAIVAATLTVIAPAGAQTPPSAPGTEYVRYTAPPRNLYRGSVEIVQLDGADRMDLVLTGLLAPPEFGRPLSSAYAGVLSHISLPFFVDPGVVDTVRSFARASAGEFTDLYNSDFDFADVNNDGRLDFAVVGSSRIAEPSAKAFLVTQVDSLVFESLSPGWTPVSHGSVAWGDYTNDGRPDLLLTGKSGDQHVTQIYQNQGGLSFQDVGAELPGIAFGEAVWGDSDNDGDLDILLSGALSSGGFVSAVYLNEGGRFTRADASLKGLAFGHARWIDMNADGLLDIILSGARQTPFILESTLLTYINEGENTFRLLPQDVDTHFDGDFDLIDWEPDGDIDIVASGYVTATARRSARIFLNEAGRFQPFYTGIHTMDMSFAVGDFDRDLDSDLYVTGQNPDLLGLVTPQGAFWLRRNTSPNSRPSSPDNLIASVNGRRVVLSWGPSTDDHTPNPSLTYALRVGSSPGGINVVSPLSNPSSGGRYLCRPGNAFHNTSLPLEGLAPGTYYWSVQAVDQSCVGSAFADEGTFTIPGVSTRFDEQPLHAFALEAPHPNPSNGPVELRFTLDAPHTVRLEIYDLLGRKVRSVLNSSQPAGTSTIVWDGRDESGRTAASGVYVARFQAAGRTETRTLVRAP